MRFLRGEARQFYERLIQILCAAVEARIRLDRPREDGTTLREHLVSYWRQTDEYPDELYEPTIPPPAEFVWIWFWELDSARVSNGMGPARLSFLEIKAWAELTENDPQPWEVAALMRMDRVLLGSPASGSGGLEN